MDRDVSRKTRGNKRPAKTPELSRTTRGSRRAETTPQVSFWIGGAGLACTCWCDYSKGNSIMNEEKDCSQTYVPIWKRQIIIFLLMLALAAGGIIAAALRHITLFYILFGVGLAVTVIISFILRCPACSCYICWNTKTRGYGTRAFAAVPFDKKCPRCGAILRK